jgi:hypothetical protein
MIVVIIDAGHDGLYGFGGELRDFGLRHRGKTNLMVQINERDRGYIFQR